MCDSLSEVYKGSAVADNIVKVLKGEDLIFDRGSESYDPLIDAYLDKCTLEGYTAASGAVLAALNQLILDLVSESIINAVGDRGVKVSNYLDALWVFASNSSSDSDAATLNLLDVDSFQCTKVNSPVYGAGGFTGDGIGAYLETGIDLSSDPLNYQLNSASVYFYNRSNDQTNGQVDLETIDNMNNRTTLNTRFNSTFAGVCRLNNLGASRLGLTLSDLRGFWHLNRKGASSTDLELSVNGVVQSTTTTGNPSSGSIPSGTTLKLMCNNLNESLTAFSKRQFSVFGIGGDLSGKELVFYNIIQAYMTSIGQNV